jgi:hypothetical protein
MPLRLRRTGRGRRRPFDRASGRNRVGVGENAARHAGGSRPPIRKGLVGASLGCASTYQAVRRSLFLVPMWISPPEPISWAELRDALTARTRRLWTRRLFFGRCPGDSDGDVRKRASSPAGAVHSWRDFSPGRRSRSRVAFGTESPNLPIAANPWGRGHRSAPSSLRARGDGASQTSTDTEEFP